MVVHKIFILKILILVLSSISYADMYGIEVRDLETDQPSVRNAVVHAINTISNKFVWEIQHSTISYSYTVTSGTFYCTDVVVRVADKNDRDTLLLTTTNYMEQNRNKIDKGIVYRHDCFNDGIPGLCKGCEVEIEWEK